ncbi:MAG: hypothetical protein IKW39_03840 [Alphaproteobacteria bacterium]|nr:hypothetical protein [Alphaproteobacteria bacterium]
MADKLKESIEYVAEKLEEGIKKIVVTSAVVISSLTGSAKENVITSPINEKQNNIEQTIKNDADLNKDTKNISFNEAQELENLKLEREKPCSKKEANISIGIFSNQNLYSTSISDIDKNARPDIDGIERPEYHINSMEDFKEQCGTTLAACHDGEHFTLPKYYVSQEFRAYLDSISMEDKAGIEYLKNNPVAEVAIKTHEVDVHGTHYAKNINDNNMDTPYTAMYKSDLTEKIASYSEWLVIAQIYTNLKERGVENIQINGEKIPLDNILNYKPGLREIVEKDGFSLNEEKCLTQIAKASSEFWDYDKAEAYKDQALCAASAEGTMSSLIGMIKNAREFEQQKDEMYKDIKIVGHELNIPKEAKQFLEPTKERMDYILHGKVYASNEDLLKIDKYMETLGLKNDKEKAEYIIKQTRCITERSLDADLKFRDILLACGNTTNKDKTIIYKDGIKDTYHSDGTVTVSKNNKKISYTTEKNNLDKTSKINKARRELNENLSKIHPTVENVKETPKQNLNMAMVMQAKALER